MSKTIVLDLSQEEAININNNGDYETVIAKQVKLEQGDELTIKNAFIDTTSVSQNKIVIDRDIDLSFNIAKYSTNFKIADKTYLTGDAEFKPDGRPYMLCNYFSSGPDPSGQPSTLYEYIEELQWGIDRPTEQWGEGEWVISYLDMDTGSTVHKSFNIPSFPTNVPTYAVKNLKIPIRKGTFVNLTQNGYKNIKFLQVIYGAVPAQLEIAHPIIEVLTVPISKGIYEPNSLALTITTALSNNNADKEFTSVIDSKFLDVTTNLSAQSLLLRGDLLEGYTYSANNYYIGASQVELLFNDETQSFYWNYLHFPYYDSASGSIISVGYLADGSGTNFIATVNSGVFFTGITAFEAGTTTLFDFWAGKLGFNVSSLEVDTGHQSNVVIGAQSFTSAPTFSVEVGKSVTGGYAGLDTVVKKGASVYIEPAVPFDSSITLTEPIYAPVSISDIGLSSSHLLLELTGSFMNDFRNSEITKTTISSIISRYYGYENFTSAEGGGIVYVHRGEPVYIKKLGVRILEPDLTLSKVGPKNHIYVEVVKTNDNV